MVWCGVVWCGVVWCGVARRGVVWCGVVWYGQIRLLMGCQATNTSLYHYLRERRRSTMPLRLLYRFSHQIAEGMQYLEAATVVHGKPTDS